MTTPTRKIARQPAVDVMAKAMTEAQPGSPCSCGCGRYPANRYAAYVMGHRPKEDVLDRFARRFELDAESDCWVWQGKPMKGGYGRFWDGEGVVMAHRFSLSQVEDVSADLEVDHLCRNTACVNPDHLEQVTGDENKRRAMAARLPVTHCKRGHLYDEANTHVNQSGYRECVLCRTANRQAWLQSRRDAK